MDIDARFPTKLETIFDAPEPFRTVLLNNIPPGETIRLLVHSPRFSTVNINSPATILTVTDSGWLVAIETEDGGARVEKSDFEETLFIEFASILISGQFTIHFASVGTSYSVTIKFDTVWEEYYLEAIDLILNGIDQISSSESREVRDAALLSDAWPFKLRADVERYRPKGQPLLAAIQWASVVGRFQQELSPAGALLVTTRELILISEEKTFPLQPSANPYKSGRIVTYFPLTRLADFHIGHQERFGVLALQVYAMRGEEKLEFVFPSDCEQAVSKAMENVLIPTGN